MVSLSCEELFRQSKLLLRERTDRSEYVFEDDDARRRRSEAQLDRVKAAMKDKGC